MDKLKPMYSPFISQREAVTEWGESQYAEGFAEGFEEGFEGGFAEGFAEEVAKQAQDTASRLYARGMSVDDIADFVNFNTATVREWLKPTATQSVN